MRNMWGLIALREQDIGYFILQTEEYQEALYGPSYEEIQELLEKAFEDFKVEYLMSEIKKQNTTDIHGFLISATEFNKAWQEGNIP